MVNDSLSESYMGHTVLYLTQMRLGPLTSDKYSLSEVIDLARLKT